jgi:hypothetical protein
MAWIMAFAAAAPAQAQDYSAWAHSKIYYYDTSPSGAAVPGNVTGFPVLVRLTAADFPFSEARGSGHDLRFSKPDGTPMPFEIDSYDSAAGQAAIWVLADTVKGNAQGPLFNLHWGNRSVPASGDSVKVFAGANGFAAAWHLGGRYPNARPNSVAGGMDAVPVNYDANEQTRGVIGLADSLGGGSPGDYLQTWHPFDSLSKAFTFSIWAYPTAVAPWARVMDFGNGAGQDNLVLGRSGVGDSLIFENWTGTKKSTIAVDGAIALREWQHFAVTVSGKSARIYRNGIELAAGEFADTIPAVPRTTNYMGRGNWSNNAYYRGILDEPEVSAVARSADWIKLAYANQKPAQTLLSFAAPCAPVFGAPGDTSVAEGTELTLAGAADCADQFEWSVTEGPAVRLLDAEVEVLVINVPRVIADTALVLRFAAHYGDSVESRSVRIAIKNTIPDPKFSLPKDILWSGRDSLLLRPQWANLAQVEDSGMPDLHVNWSLTGLAVDTVWSPDGLWLLPSPDHGVVEAELCIDNGGPSLCQATQVTLALTTGMRPRPHGRASGRRRFGYGADGRLRAEAGPFPKLYVRPGRLRP